VEPERRSERKSQMSHINAEQQNLPLFCVIVDGRILIFFCCVGWNWNIC